MKDMVKWLREVEHLACEFYLRAATYFADDPRLKKFLMKTDERARKIIKPFEQDVVANHQVTAGISLFYFEEETQI